ncbi:MAG: DMT family transporter [Bacteroidetes bacterium]|nr:DMT family transporter [Bacteroidota bacterium]
MEKGSTIIKWVLFISVAFIWGSSFELMKLGLFENHDLSKPVLTSWQVAALRLTAAGLVLIPFIRPSLKKTSKKDIGYIALSGVLGSFIPSFLFTLSETKIDGAFAGTLNSLTPVFVIVIALFFFKKKITAKAYTGILIALIGSTLVFYFNWRDHGSNSLGVISFALFSILATAFYGLNVNMMNKVLSETHPLATAVIALVTILIPSAVVLYLTGYFSLPLGESKYILATLSSVTLGAIGTSLASVLFYALIQRAGYLFASMVTYGTPFIAQFWGWINGEKVDIFRIIGLIIILIGIYIATQVKKDA